MTPAAQARKKAGLELTEAAQQASICETYLRRVEKSGGCSYPLAQRLSRLYRCSANVFLMKQSGSETPNKRKSKRCTPASIGCEQTSKKPDVGEHRAASGNG